MDYKVPNIVKEYVSVLSDEELKFLHMRLDQKFTGDQAEALQIVQRHEGVDNWLKAAKNHEEFYFLLDLLFHQMDHESKRRGR
jgi:hypothetical protein